jgi:tRNA threonylcarbamoyladenosine biosynthesis protein TsaB
MPAVADLLAERGIAASSIARVVCGAGPGSFTSLRISGAIAKGIALAAVCPLVPVSSLALLAGSLRDPAAGRYLAALDAMRGEHYAALFEIGPTGALSMLGGPTRLATGELLAHAESVGALIVGPEQEGEARVGPHARAASRLTGLIDSTPPADLAGWEPAYGRLAEAQVKWEAQHGRPLEVA